MVSTKIVAFCPGAIVSSSGCSVIVGALGGVAAGSTVMVAVSESTAPPTRTQYRVVVDSAGVMYSEPVAFGMGDDAWPVAPTNH